jgi:PEP-CTERM motif-containing protein
MRSFLTAALLAARTSLPSSWSSAGLRVSLAAALIATSMVEGLAPSHASTLIAEVSGDPIGAAGISAGNAISFTTTSLFTDVTISALLYSSTGDPGTGSATVYLTDSIGAGTTTANEIARATLTDLPVLFSTSTPEVVFTGLTLPAGTYYVIEASDTGSAVGADWGEPEFPVETTAPGVTIHTDLIASSLASYSPASAFAADTGDGFAFSITGSPVPEPSTWAMMMLGFAGLGYAGFRSARARRLGAA